MTLNMIIVHSSFDGCLANPIANTDPFDISSPKVIWINDEPDSNDFHLKFHK